MPKPSLPSRSTFGRRLLALGAFVALGAIAISAGCGSEEQGAEAPGQVLAPADGERAAAVESEHLQPGGEVDVRVEGGSETPSPETGLPSELDGSSLEQVQRPPLDVGHYASLADPHDRGLLIHVLDQEGQGVEAVVWILEAGRGLSDRQLRDLREGGSWPGRLAKIGGHRLGLTDPSGWMRTELPTGPFWIGADSDTSVEYGIHVNWTVGPPTGIERFSLEDAVLGPVKVSLRPTVSTLPIDVVWSRAGLEGDSSEIFKDLRLQLRKREGAVHRVAATGHLGKITGRFGKDRVASTDLVLRYEIWDAAQPMVGSPGGWEVVLEGGEALGAQPVPVTIDDVYIEPDDYELPVKALQVPAFGGLDLTVRGSAGENLARPFELVLRRVREPGEPLGKSVWRRNWEGHPGPWEHRKPVDPDTGKSASRFVFAPLPLGVRFEARLRMEGSSYWHRTELNGPTTIAEVVEHEWRLGSAGVVRLAGQLALEGSELPETGVPRFLLVRDGLPLAGDLRRPPLNELHEFQLEFDESEVVDAADLALRITWLDHWAQIPLPELVPGKPFDLGRVTLGEAPLLVAGRVVGTDGRGLGGVRVSIAARNGERADGEPRYDDLADVAFSDADGAFEFRGRVAADALGLRAESARFARQNYVEVLPGTGNASLQLWPGGQVSGRVAAGAVLPAERLELELQGPDGNASTERQRPQPDGSFQFDSLEFDRDYTVALNYRGLARGAQPWTLVPAVAARSQEPPSYGASPSAAPGLDPLELDPLLRTIELDVLESGGASAERFQVRVTDAETGQFLEQLQGADGRWELTLPDTPVDLEVWSDASARVLIPAARNAERVVLSDPVTVTLELMRAEDLRFDGEPVPEYRMAVGLRRVIDDQPVQLPSLKSLVGPKGRARFQGLTFGSFEVQLQVSDPASGRSGWVDLQLDPPPRLDLTPDNADQLQRVSAPRAALLDAVVAALELDAGAESGE